LLGIMELLPVLPSSSGAAFRVSFLVGDRVIKCSNRCEEDERQSAARRHPGGENHRLSGLYKKCSIRIFCKKRHPSWRKMLVALGVAQV
jgi:hypothetical protein